MAYLTGPPPVAPAYSAPAYSPIKHITPEQVAFQYTGPAAATAPATYQGTPINIQAPKALSAPTLAGVDPFGVGAISAPNIQSVDPITAQQVNAPGMAAIGKIDVNKQGLEAFRAKALGQDNWTGLQMQREQMGMEDQRNQALLGADVQSRQQSEEAAMRGGLTGGSAERISQGNARAAQDRLQQVQRESAGRQLGIQVAGDERSTAMLAQLPGMELQALSPELQARQMEAARQSQLASMGLSASSTNAANALTASQFSASQLAATRAKNAELGLAAGTTNAQLGLQAQEAWGALETERQAKAAALALQAATTSGTWEQQAAIEQATLQAAIDAAKNQYGISYDTLALARGTQTLAGDAASLARAGYITDVGHMNQGADQASIQAALGASTAYNAYNAANYTTAGNIWATGEQAAFDKAVQAKKDKEDKTGFMPIMTGTSGNGFDSFVNPVGQAWDAYKNPDHESSTWETLTNPVAGVAGAVQPGSQTSGWDAVTNPVGSAIDMVQGWF